jgi:hypothetical protein
MSILIDKLVRMCTDATTACFKEEHGDVWYLAESFGKNTLLIRIKDSIKVLLGRSYAYHYKRLKDKV